MKNILMNLKIPALLLVLALFGLGIHQALAATTLTTQLSIGSRGTNVSNLQSFLASNPTIYPEGLVTGYYGTLTRRAVENFQNAYDLPAVGRVGPLTLATFNRIAASGRGIDISAPWIYNMSVNTQTSRQATISWTTNEMAVAKVYYDTRPIAATEAVGSFREPTFNASWVMVGTGMSTGQSITLSNLNPGTIYYYYVVSTDASGNVSVSTQKTFTAI